ncbi:hypothetical protein VTI74DRAFT_1566 [Chaetomium olivicolor]
MASVPAQIEQQQGQQPVDPHGIENESADLDSVDAVQLIAKTTSLTISGSGSEAEEAPLRSHEPRMPPLLDTAHSEDLLLPLGAQPSAVIGREWQGDTLGRSSRMCCSMRLPSPSCPSETGSKTEIQPGGLKTSDGTAIVLQRGPQRRLEDLPNEVLLQILSYLDVCDLLATSRTSHHLRTLSLTPYLHATRLRLTRTSILPPLLTSPSRPTLADLIRRSIFLTRTTFASRRLARNLASIRLARQLASRPSPETLVERCVLPPECLPPKASNGGGGGVVAPALVARKRAVERERVKDGLRRWVGSVWRGEVRLRGEGVREWEERVGVGRVWRLRRFWERVGRGEV